MGFYICSPLVHLKISNQDSRERVILNAQRSNTNNLNQDHLSPTLGSGQPRMNYSQVAAIPFCLEAWVVVH